ncbi:MAG TPA: hypothetical protein VFM18_13390 [Methanosarcina sp.]|nr:hypothetical protein [Methanosarcina sp.]
MNTTTNNSASSDRPTVENIIGFMKHLKENLKPQWMLVGPDGKVYTGDQKAVARVLLQNLDITSLFN